MTTTQQQILARVADLLRDLATLLDGQNEAAEITPPAPAPAPRPRPEPGPAEQNGQAPRPTRPSGSFDGVPTTGGALYLWLKSLEEEHGLKCLVADVTRWGKLQGWGHKFINWDAHQVAEAIVETQHRVEQAEHLKY